jgi:uncharacterized protein (TIGR03435 family)
MQDLDDNTLLNEYVARDSEEAFAALVERHVNKVYSVALRHTGNAHRAEEITQAVFVILAKKSRRLSKKVVLSGWLYHTARLASVTLIRSEIRRAHRQQNAHMQTFTDKPESDDWQQIAPLLDAAMAELNDGDRHAVVLRFFDKKSMREVGTALGATEDAAKKRVERAVEKLRKYFSKRGVNSTTAIITGAISANSVQLAPAGLAKMAASAAIAKGAGVGGSTLTIIKGALKVMALTKAKTVVVVGVSLLFATGATVIVERAIIGRSPGGGSSADASWVNNPRTWELNSAVLNSLPAGAFILRPTQFANSGGGVSDLNRCLWKNVPIETLIATAYSFPETRIVLSPDLPSGRFDLLMTVADHPKEKLQEQIKIRFGFIAHKENREVDVLRLKVNNSNPPNLKPHASNDRNSSWVGEDQKIIIRNQSLGGFINSIESNIGQPVLDETDLKGRYDLQLQFPSRRVKFDKDAYLRALFEQLGLELVPDRASIEELVVEKAD